jgi:hypothetical protein
LLAWARYFHTLREFTGDVIHLHSEIRVGELLDALAARQPGPEQPGSPDPRPEEPVTTPPTPETPGTGDPSLPPADPDPDPIPGPDPAPPTGPGYSV